VEIGEILMNRQEHQQQRIMEAKLYRLGKQLARLCERAYYTSKQVSKTRFMFLSPNDVVYQRCFLQKDQGFFLHVPELFSIPEPKNMWLGFIPGCSTCLNGLSHRALSTGLPLHSSVSQLSKFLSVFTCKSYFNVVIPEFCSLTSLSHDGILWLTKCSAADEKSLRIITEIAGEILRRKSQAKQKTSKIVFVAEGEADRLVGRQLRRIGLANPLHNEEPDEIAIRIIDKKTKQQEA
jgi:hypothetical protein